ncbi:hypothetical protein Tco_0397632 [Tanacetum coccineum]
MDGTGACVCQDSFCLREGMDGLSEFFPHPFRIIDMSSIDDAQRICNTGALGLSNPEVFPAGMSKRGGKCSEKVGMFQNDPPQSCRLGSFVTFQHPDSIAISLAPTNARPDLSHCACGWCNSMSIVEDNYSGEDQ